MDDEATSPTVAGANRTRAGTGPNGAASAGSASTDPATASAELAVRIMPRFNRWASTQVLQGQLGGDLSLRQVSVLYLIREESTTLGYVARRMMVTPAVVTGIVDRLEKRGYVRRAADPDDRRVVRLVLTDAGRKASEAVTGSLESEVAARLEAYPEKRLQELRRSLELLNEVVTALEESRERPRR